MRNLALLLGLLAPFNSGFGQVTVEVTLDQDQFLVAETIVAAVRIANRSGQTLLLGGAAGWLAFSVEARDGLIVSKSDEAPAAVGGVRGEDDHQVDLSARVHAVPRHVRRAAGPRSHPDHTGPPPHVEARRIGKGREKMIADRRK